MNRSTLAQPAPINTRSVAFTFGARDAQAGEPCVPECIFLARPQQREYAAGYESLSGPTATTAQFTGSAILAAIVVPNYKANDREFTRRTDSNVTRMFQASQARDKRIDAMIEMTAEFMGGIFAGDILWAA